MSDDDVTLPEVGRRLIRVEEKLDQFFADAVLRAEFEARLTGHDREIRDLKTAALAAQQVAQQRQVPWTAIASVIVAAIAVAVVLIPLIANG